MKPRQIVSLLVLLAVLSAGGYYIASHHERFAVIARVPASGVVALAALAFLGWSIGALLLRVTFGELGSSVSPLESHLLVWTAQYWNYLPMKPGLYAQAVFMKRRRDLSYSRFLAYVLAMNLVASLSRGVLGVLITVPIWLGGELTPLVPAAFAVVTGGCAALMALPTQWQYGGRRRVLRTICRVGSAWHQIRASRVLACIALWKTAQVLVQVAYLNLCFQLVGIEGALPQALIVVLLTPLSSLAGLVPGGLGVREALVGVVVMAFGGTLADGVVAATLGRAVRLAMTLVLGPIASHRVFSRLVPPVQPEPDDEPAAGDREGR